MSEITAKAVKLPNDKDINLSQHFQAIHQTWPVISLAGGLIVIDVLRRNAGLDQRIVLQIQNLGTVGLGDTGVSDQHDVSQTIV